MYEVKDCVCDYAIYENGSIISELILNSRTNAQKICDILNLDDKHLVYEDTTKTVNINNVGTFNNRKN